MTWIKNRNTRALILIMCALVSIGAAISWYYYRNLNRSVDPRVAEARALYSKYNGYALRNAYDSVFLLMDSIERIYHSIDHYRSSFETGVLYNNRAAAWLTLAVNGDAGTSGRMGDSLVNLADSAVRKSLGIYEAWVDTYRDKSAADISNIIAADFLEGLGPYDAQRKEKFLKHRVGEIEESLTETERRLSVSYTNLGIIYRYREQYDSAATCYLKAIDLWDKNLTAENNLNILLGRPIRKRNFIQRMFPPDRQ